MQGASRLASSANGREARQLVEEVEQQHSCPGRPVVSATFGNGGVTAKRSPPGCRSKLGPNPPIGGAAEIVVCDHGRGFAGTNVPPLTVYGTAII
jgi:hypothetical protein